MGDHTAREQDVDPVTEAIELPALPPALAEQLADPALGAQPGDVSRVVEVKVIVSAAVTLVASLIVAILNAVLADSRIIGDLPPWLQFVILAAIPPVLAFAAGYRQPSNRV